MTDKCFLCRVSRPCVHLAPSTRYGSHTTIPRALKTHTYVSPHIQKTIGFHNPSQKSLVKSYVDGLYASPSIFMPALLMSAFCIAAELPSHVFMGNKSSCSFLFFTLDPHVVARLLVAKTEFYAVWFHLE
jgi:hypothetical protein